MLHSAHCCQALILEPFDRVLDLNSSFSNLYTSMKDIFVVINVFTGTVSVSTVKTSINSNKICIYHEYKFESLKVKNRFYIIIL